MKTEYMMVTPDIASSILLNNTGNRKLRTNLVIRYADDMKKGNWGMSHQGIAIDINGNLIDGQHRLHAVLKSGATVPMLVTTGMAPEAFEIIDKLCARSDADSLRISQKEAEVFKLIASTHTCRTRPSIDALKKCISVFSPKYDELDFSRSNIKSFSSASVRAAAIIAATEKPENTKAIATAYDDMLHSRVDCLSVSGRSIVRSVYNGTIKTGSGASRTDMMQRFFTFFCMDNNDLTKIHPTNIERIRKIIAEKWAN